MKLVTAGESAVLVYLGGKMSPETLALAQNFCKTLTAKETDWLMDLLPSYCSVLVQFDSQKISSLAVRRYLKMLVVEDGDKAFTQSRTVEIPVYYDNQWATDIALVAAHNGLTEEQVVELHHSREYLVYSIGFAPGFAYLGELDTQLQMPRHQTPRAKVPKGAVAIADRQTAVYPASSPGGWHILGISPMTFFDTFHTPHMPVKVGDKVRFTPISRDEFLASGGEMPEPLS